MKCNRKKLAAAVCLFVLACTVGCADEKSPDSSTPQPKEPVSQTEETTQPVETAGSSQTVENESLSPVYISDVVDDSFKTENITFVQTEDNVIETSDGAITFTIAADAAGDEEGNHNFTAVVKNNTQNSYYLDKSGIQGGMYDPDGVYTTLPIAESLYSLDPNSETTISLMETSIEDGHDMAIKFSDVTLIDVTGKTVYECEFAAFKYID